MAERSRKHLVLEAYRRIGDSWRNRWDSLKLFTPARYNGLPDFPFPADGWTFPTKDQMADYLEAYAARFDLPVRTGVRVEKVSRDGDRLWWRRKMPSSRPRTWSWPWRTSKDPGCLSSRRS